MFKPGTVLVLGAGASHELGLPLGSGLAKLIADLTYMTFEFNQLKKGDYRFFETLRRNFQDNEELNRHLRACRQIHEGVVLAESIDNYIDRQRDDAIALCGKLAIASLISKAEAASPMFVKQDASTLSFEGMPDCWHMAFFRILSEGIPRERLGEIFNGLAIIDFNYDRCVPHFLRHALSRAYGISQAEADNIVATLNHVRPYGQVAPLRRAEGHDGTHFGEAVDGDRLVSISKGLKTFTEQADDDALRGNLATVIETASQIIFLGFAFHRQNIALLGSASENCRIVGTAKGFSGSDTEAIVEQLRNELYSQAPAGPITLEKGLTCAQLLQDYRRTIAA